MVFERVNRANIATIHVKPFMEDLKNWYVGSLEYGWEVYTRGGSWKVNSMGLNL